MQAKFAPELRAIVNRNRLAKRSPLHNVDRGLGIAKNNRTARAVSKLTVVSQAEASRIVKYGKYANVLGTGLVAIDFGTRIGNVRTEYMGEGDWSRALFRESLSFFGATAVGYFGSKAAASVFLPVLAPFGWVFLIIGGALLAGGLVAGSLTFDKLLKKYSNDAYDL